MPPPKQRCALPHGRREKRVLIHKSGGLCRTSTATTATSSAMGKANSRLYLFAAHICQLFGWHGAVRDLYWAATVYKPGKRYFPFCFVFLVVVMHCFLNCVS